MATGMRTTYTDTGITRRTIRNAVEMIDWTSCPLIKFFGLDNASRFDFGNSWPGTKYEWIQDTMSARSTTLGAAVEGTTDPDTWTFTDGSLAKEGDVWQVDSEYVYVSAVSSNSVTVKRGYGGTTPATHLISTAIYLRFPARLEGADADTGHTTTTTQPYNYTQIFEEAVKVSGTQQAIRNDYGISDHLAYQIAKLIGGNNGIGTKGKAGKLSLLLANTFYYGKRAAGTDGTARAMGGIDTFVTTNLTNCSSAALKLSNIVDMLQTIYTAGGQPDTIITDMWGKRKISQFFEGTIRTDRSEKEGGQVISSITTDFGDVDVLLDWMCPAGQMHVIEKEKMGWITLRDWFVEKMAKTGDSETHDIVGEFGFVCMNDGAHGKIYGYAVNK